MILYHFSDIKYSKLIPKLEPRGHLGKEKITGKKITILTNKPNMFYENDNGGNFFKYRYVVKLDANDPCLHADDKFNNMLEKYNKAFGSKCATFKWFFYDNPLDYSSISQWDKKLCKFSDE